MNATFENKALKRRQTMLVLLIFGATLQLRAEMAVPLLVGGGVGTLSSPDATTATLSVFPVGGGLEYHTGPALSSRFTLGLMGYGTQVSYKVKGVAYSGTYSAAAATLGVILQVTTKYQLELHGEGLGLGTLSVKSKTAVLVNDAIFRSSTLQTYTGGTAAIARVAIVRETKRGKKKYDIGTRIGIGVDAMQQAFTTLATTNTSNNSSIEGESKTVIRSASKLSYTAVVLTVAIVF